MGHLRKILIRHGRQAAAFERWLAAGTLDLAGTPHIKGSIELVRWRYLKRLRANGRSGEDPE